MASRPQQHKKSTKRIGPAVTGPRVQATSVSPDAAADKPRNARREVARSPVENTIRARRARIRATPRKDGKPKLRDVLSTVPDREFEADIARFLDTLR